MTFDMSCYIPKKKPEDYIVSTLRKKYGDTVSFSYIMASLKC